MNYACSFGFLSPAFRGNYVGLGATFYNKGFACGQCIMLQCDDAACKQPGKQLLAMVVDLCGGYSLVLHGTACCCLVLRGDWWQMMPANTFLQSDWVL